MRQWFERPPTRNVGDELLALGTNNLPLLVKLVAYDPRKDIFRSVCRLCRLTHSARVRDIADRRLVLAEDAYRLLNRLGPRAAPAIPQLARIAEHAGEQPSGRAMSILIRVGDEGISVVASRAAHADAETRRYAVGLLSESGSRVARSALTNALNDPDPRVRSLASCLIRGEQPSQADPVIMQRNQIRNSVHW
jgi:hypothetical protein